jgi:hypothetical protein
MFVHPDITTICSTDSIHCLNYIFDEFPEDEYDFFLKFYTKNAYIIDIRLPVNR